MPRRIPPGISSAAFTRVALDGGDGTHEDACVSGPRLSLVILAVDDRTTSVGFYREAFGGTVVVDTPTDAELEIPGGMRLGIYDRRSFGANFGQTPRPSGGVTT